MFGEARLGDKAGVERLSKGGWDLEADGMWYPPPSFIRYIQKYMDA